MPLAAVPPSGPAVSAEVDEVIAPGSEAEFGVLPGHTPFITAMKPGTLRYSKGGVETRLQVGGGLIEVTGADRVVVITERAVKPEHGPS
jgi:F-type H+-transporting ATPase subunit epsilon